MAAEPNESTPQKAVKVLVADDKTAGRELVKMVLEDVYEVFEARDGIEAIDMAHIILPELIILDLHMPGVDGFGVIRELRQHPALATTPMLALTASAMRGDQQRALDAGFTGYITKPVSPKELRAEVSRLLA
jgi:two-component system cell cycle response regulator DivK